MIIYIPIKEHSERVPRKNFREIKGKPLYRWFIEKFSKFTIYVDTDSDEIADGLHGLNYVCIFRREENLCGDNVPVNDLIKKFLENRASIRRPDLDINEVVTQIHVTSPLLKPETIQKAYEHFCKHKHHMSSLVSCTKFRKRLWAETERGTVIPLNHNPMVLEPTQDLDEIIEENSAFYMFTQKSFNLHMNRMGPTPGFYEVKFPECLDIDTEDDWDLCLSL